MRRTFFILLVLACQSDAGPYEAWCDAAAACDPAIDVDACVDAFDGRSITADASDCEAPFDAWSQCLHADAECIDHRYGEGICQLPADDLRECELAAENPSLDPQLHAYCVLSDTCHDASTPDGAYGPCVDTQLDARAEASTADCAFPHDLWLQCLIDQGTCVGGVPVAPACDPRRADLDECLGRE